VRAAGVAGVGLLTGWGRGLEALPESARAAAGGRRVIRLEAPSARGDRFRRATRECVLGVAAVEALLARVGLPAESLRGDGTALLYASAAAYGAANRAFIEAAAGAALHFPYTAPSAVPAEVAIEFGLTGPYVILLGGAATTVHALWQAGLLVARGAAARALVLAVETFAECEDLWHRGRSLVAWPLTEAAACALVVPGDGAGAGGPEPVADFGPGDEATDEASERARVVGRRAGETLAVAPLIALGLACEGADPCGVSGTWRGRRAALRWAAP
jgi:hypothetical protein